MQKLEEGIDDALYDFQEYLESHDDIDNIDELADLLNTYVDEDLQIDFHVNHDTPKSVWWMYAETITGTYKNGKHGSYIDVILNAKNLEGVYGPKTFKKMLMRLIRVMN